MSSRAGYARSTGEQRRKNVEFASKIMTIKMTREHRGRRFSREERNAHRNLDSIFCILNGAAAPLQVVPKVVADFLLLKSLAVIEVKNADRANSDLATEIRPSSSVASQGEILRHFTSLREAPAEFPQGSPSGKSTGVGFFPAPLQ